MGVEETPGRSGVRRRLSPIGLRDTALETGTCNTNRPRQTPADEAGLWLRRMMVLEQNPGYEKNGFIFGRVVEWSMAPASKAGGPSGPVGSNPTPSAKNGFSLALPT